MNKGGGQHVSERERQGIGEEKSRRIRLVEGRRERREGEKKKQRKRK